MFDEIVNYNVSVQIVLMELANAIITEEMRSL